MKLQFLPSIEECSFGKRLFALMRLKNRNCIELFEWACDDNLKSQAGGNLLSSKVIWRPFSSSRMSFIKFIKFKGLSIVSSRSRGQQVLLLLQERYGKMCAFWKRRWWRSSFSSTRQDLSRLIRSVSMYWTHFQAFNEERKKNWKNLPNVKQLRRDGER